MDRLSICLLGPLRVTIDDKPVTGFESDKVRALLAYLAVESRHPQRRETLAGLLWPDWTEHSARTNLRRALTNLRSAIGDCARSGDRMATPPFLHVSRQTIQFNGDGDAWVDVAAFTRLVEVDSERSSEQVVERLEKAVMLYQGRFLEGFSLADSPAFDDWVLLNRERLHRQMTDALCRLAECHEQWGDYESALRHAWQQVELDPWRERAHRQVMRLLALSGQRGAALAQYETCRRVLTEELGVEPAAETRRLYQQIRDEALEPSPSVSPQRQHNLPAQPSPFIGREATLAEIKQYLDDPSCQLLTLVGPGGSGKTRLALEAAAAQLESYAHGVFFVPLAPIRSVEAIVPTVAQAIGFPLIAAGGLDPQQKLLDYLRQKRMLLVLDSFEHLLASSAPNQENNVGVVTAILTAAAEVKLLVTSRTMLGAEGEHLFPVGGMDLPDVPPQEITDLRQYDAIELFASGARRAKPGFELTAHSAADVILICRLVGGMPLGILLAAAWTRMLTLGEIAEQIVRSIDFLATEGRDVPARHRSVRATLDHSWSLLTEREREVFRALSVFRGGFTRQAAQEVVGASLQELMALGDKSLLQRMPTGRYEIHELLRQYAEEKLDESPDESTVVRDRHCGYYAAALQRLETDLKGPRQQTVLAEMEVEIGNARAAWDWAVEHAQAARLGQALEGLCELYWAYWRLYEGQAACRMAAERLAGTTSGDGLRVLARILAREADLGRIIGMLAREADSALTVLGYPEPVNQPLQQSLAILEKLQSAGQDIRAEKAFTLLQMGMVASEHGPSREQGRQLLEQSLALYQEIGDRWWTALSLDRLAGMNEKLGAYDKAKQLAAESLAIGRVLGNSARMAEALHTLGRATLALGQLEEAEHLLQECVAINREMDCWAKPALPLWDAGRALLGLGKLNEALSLLQESQAVFEDLGISPRLASVDIDLGHVKMHLGRYQQARAHEETALALSHESGFRQKTGWSQFILGLTALATEAYTEAQQRLQESVAILQNTEPRDRCCPLAALGYVERQLGQPELARQYLVQVLSTASGTETSMPLMYALPAVALLLADMGKKGRAVEIYALASRYGFVANSPWFEDVAGRHIAASAATLPPEVAATAQKRGRARDLNATVVTLLEELSEDDARALS